jgi:hypothetical protein
MLLRLVFGYDIEDFFECEFSKAFFANNTHYHPKIRLD